MIDRILANTVLANLVFSNAMTMVPHIGWRPLLIFGRFSLPPDSHRVNSGLLRKPLMHILGRIGGMHELLAFFVHHMDAALEKGQSHRPITLAAQ